MNRILNSERCRLLPKHTDELMKISIEGPEIPDIRDGTPQEEMMLTALLNSALSLWYKKPRRSMTQSY